MELEAGAGVVDVVQAAVGEEVLVGGGGMDDVLGLGPAAGAVEEAVLVALEIKAAATLAVEAAARRRAQGLFMALGLFEGKGGAPVLVHASARGHVQKKVSGVLDNLGRCT